MKVVNYFALLILLIIVSCVQDNRKEIDDISEKIESNMQDIDIEKDFEELNKKMNLRDADSVAKDRAIKLLDNVNEMEGQE